MKKIHYELKTNRKYVCQQHSPREHWSLSMAVADVPPGIPYTPNARYASERVRTVKSMLAQMESAPQEFERHNGSGIVLVCESVTEINGGLRVTCLEAEAGDPGGHGVVDGGHTYFAILAAAEAQQALATVKVELIVATLEQVPHLSKARNLRIAVKTASEYNLFDAFAPIRDVVREEVPALLPRIVFKQGAPDAEFPIEDIVQRLALFIERRKGGPRSAYTSKQLKPYLLSNGALNPTYQRVVPHLPDVFKLEEFIIKAWEERTATQGLPNAKAARNGDLLEGKLLMSGYVPKCQWDNAFIFPAMAAFRRVIGAKPIEELWAEYGSAVISACWQAYCDMGKPNAANFGRGEMVWVQSDAAVITQVAETRPRFKSPPSKQFTQPSNESPHHSKPREPMRRIVRKRVAG